MNASDLGKRISDLRNERKMTQTELADKLSVSTQAISKWETGAGFPDIQIIPQLADIFNTTADFLLGCEKKQKILVYNVCSREVGNDRCNYDIQLNDKYLNEGWKIVQSHLSSDSEQTYIMVVLER